LDGLEALLEAKGKMLKAVFWGDARGVRAGDA